MCEEMFKTTGEMTTDSEEDYSEISGSDRDEERSRKRLGWALGWALGRQEITWIEWFCHLKGNEFFVEVDEDYIQVPWPSEIWPEE